MKGRLIVGILGPSFIGSIMFILIPLGTKIVSGGDASNALFNFANGFVVLYLFAFVSVGIQSIVFACVMEFLIAKITTSLLIFVIVAATLGFLSAIGAVIILDGYGSSSGLPETLRMIGLSVGVILGFILHRMHRFEK